MQTLIKQSLSGLLAIGLLTGNAAADDPLDEPAGASTMEEILVVGGRLPRPVDDVVGSVDVISSEALTEMVAVRMSDAVRYTPGVSVLYSNVRFGDSGFTIRGLGGNRVLTLIDHVPVNDHFDIGSFSHAGQDYFTPETISRIEILRGPASTLFGSDALGGVVGIVTRDPEEYLRGESLGFEIGSAYSGADEAVRVSGSAAARMGATSGIVQLSRIDGNELDHKANGPSDSSERIRDAIFAKVAHQTGNVGRLLLSFQGFDEDTHADMQSVLGFGRQFRNTTRLEGDDDRDRYQIGLAYEFEPGFAKVARGATSFYFQSSNVKQVTDELRDLVAGPVAIQRIFDYDHDTLGMLLDAESLFDTGAGRHRLGWGMNVQRTEISERRDGSQTDLTSGDTTNVLLGESMPVRDFPNSTVLDVGLYLYDEISVGPVTLVPGVRVESYHLDADADPLFRDDNPTTKTHDVDEVSVAPKFGLIWDVNGSLQTFVQYARGFRAPPFADVNIGLDIPMFNIRAIPNPDLRAETSDGLELGARWNGSAMSVSASLFGANYDDFIESKVNLGPDPDTGTLLFQSRNIDSARIYGADLALSYELEDLLPIAKGWSVATRGSITRGEDRSSDRPLNSIDPAEVITTLQWREQRGRYRVALITTLVAEKDRVDETSGELYQPDAFAVLDLTAAFLPMPRVRINAGLFNLFDEKYWRWSSVRGRPENDPMLGTLSAPGFHGAVSINVTL